MSSRGMQLIAEERERQISQEGWTPEHDSQHTKGELVKSAQCYSQMGNLMANFSGPENKELCAATSKGERWPWGDDWWKPSEDPIRNLQKAGALIAAEIDRILRERESHA